MDFGEQIASSQRHMISRHLSVRGKGKEPCNDSQGIAGTPARSYTMPNESQNQEIKLILSGPNSLGRIHIDTEAFFELSFWLAEELEDLVARWQHVGPRQRPVVDHRQRLPI